MPEYIKESHKVQLPSGQCKTVKGYVNYEGELSTDRQSLSYGDVWYLQKEDRYVMWDGFNWAPIVVEKSFDSDYDQMSFEENMRILENRSEILENREKHSYIMGLLNFGKNTELMGNYTTYASSALSDFMDTFIGSSFDGI